MYNTKNKGDLYEQPPRYHRRTQLRMKILCRRVTEVSADGIASGRLRITVLVLCMLTEAFFDACLGIDNVIEHTYVCVGNILIHMK